MLMIIHLPVQVARKRRPSRKVLLILKADGSERVNIKMYLPMRYKLPVIRTAGFWALVYIPEIIMTAELSTHCMTR